MSSDGIPLFSQFLPIREFAAAGSTVSRDKKDSMGKKKRKVKPASSGKNRTPISGHTRSGSQLLPPFANPILKMKPASWMNERLPEMLWAALIRVAVPRDRGLELFRRFLKFVAEHPEKDKLSDLILTGFSKLEQPLREQVITHLVAPPEAAQALAALLWFAGLPARDTWDKLLPGTEPDVQLLMAAVGAHLS